MVEWSDAELAAACAAGDAAAIAELERRFGPSMQRALARLRLDPATADDVLQTVRTKLFVGTEGRGPAIGSFAGTGSLGGWLAAVVVHAATSALRARRADVDGASKLDEAAVDDDPAIAAARRAYGASFKQAFQDAFRELTARERNVLRLVVAEGVAVEQVAVVYGVHRVSVSRWLGDARAKLQSSTRALLATRLDLQMAEAESVARLCLSEIDVSLDRLLAS